MLTRRPLRGAAVVVAVGGGGGNGGGGTPLTGLLLLLLLLAYVRRRVIVPIGIRDRPIDEELQFRRIAIDIEPILAAADGDIAIPVPVPVRIPIPNTLHRTTEAMSVLCLADPFLCFPFPASLPSLCVYLSRQAAPRALLASSSSSSSWQSGVSK